VLRPERKARVHDGPDRRPPWDFPVGGHGFRVDGHQNSPIVIDTIAARFREACLDPFARRTPLAAGRSRLNASRSRRFSAPQAGRLTTDRLERELSGNWSIRRARGRGQPGEAQRTMVAAARSTGASSTPPW
jgi:hypothetical protein